MYKLYKAKQTHQKIPTCQKKPFCQKIPLYVVASLFCLCVLSQGCHKGFANNASNANRIISPCNIEFNTQNTPQNPSQHLANQKDFASPQDLIKNIESNFANLRVSIISTQNPNEHLLFADFINTISKTDILLLGEKHDEKSHHKAQLLIIQALEASFLSQNELAQNPKCDKRVSIVLEMLGSDSAKHIDEASNQKDKIQKEHLKTALGWGKWDYKQYKEILEYVFYSRSFEIIAGNLSREEISTIYKGAQELRGNLSTTKDAKEKISKIIAKSHKTNDESLLKKLTEIQQYKDRRMADKLFHSPHFAILLAGNYHIANTFGIPLHIADFKASNETNPQNTLGAKKVISVGMQKERHLKSKKHRQNILSHYDYILVFR
ncbi:ChaN family lipoprotein [Helicobacter sp. T3_23-1059]